MTSTAYEPLLMPRTGAPGLTTRNKRTLGLNSWHRRGSSKASTEPPALWLHRFFFRGMLVVSLHLHSITDTLTFPKLSHPTRSKGRYWGLLASLLGAKEATRALFAFSCGGQDHWLLFVVQFPLAENNHVGRTEASRCEPQAGMGMGSRWFLDAKITQIDVTSIP